MFNDIICICGLKIKEKEFKSHYKKCKSFVNKFTKFDYRIASTIEEYTIDKDNLFIVKYLFKRYLKRINKKIKEYEKDLKKKYNNKEEELKNLIKNNKNILFGDIPGGEPSFTKDVLRQNLKYIMKDEELEDCSPIFKDFVNINLLKENADEMAPKPVRNDISAPPLNNYSTSNSYFNSENQGEEFNKSQTRNPDDNSKLISKSKLEDKFNYFTTINKNILNC